METKDLKNAFIGFSKLDFEKRLLTLKKLNILNESQINFLKQGQIDREFSENFIENSLGYYHLPLGVLPCFILNNKTYTVPLVTEETSVIASLCKTVKWINESGQISASCDSYLGTGQIHFPKVKDFKKLESTLLSSKKDLIKKVNEEVISNLVRRGGGLKEIELRKIETDKALTANLHLYIDTCDAMGANMINQSCEFIKPFIEDLTGEKASICILSNLMDQKCVQAEVCIEAKTKEEEESLFEKIEEASYFAETDIYRAATSNKGVLNGIDALVIATGNDWRAVESAAHSYASSKGSYTSLTQWRKKGNKLVGKIKLPVPVGIVGGVTKSHPGALLNLEMLKVDSAKELSFLCASLGLVQNLAALKALISEGITQGHMKLHIQNLMLGLDLNEQEKKELKKKADQFLKSNNFINNTVIKNLLKEIKR